MQENVILDEEDDLSDIDIGDDELKHKIRMLLDLNIENNILQFIPFWFCGLNILTIFIYDIFNIFFHITYSYLKIYHILFIMYVRIHNKIRFTIKKNWKKIHD